MPKAHKSGIPDHEIEALTDVALSDAPNYDENYLYTRIIRCHGICFSTGLNLVFSKKDAFIKQHIRQHSKDYNRDY